MILRYSISYINYNKISIHSPIASHTPPVYILSRRPISGRRLLRKGSRSKHRLLFALARVVFWSRQVHPHLWLSAVLYLLMLNLNHLDETLWFDSHERLLEGRVVLGEQVPLSASFDKYTLILSPPRYENSRCHSVRTFDCQSPRSFPWTLD
jgi:hypothetical protein